MQKNVIKFLALFVALICIFYFFRKTQLSQNVNNKVESNTSAEIYETTLPDDFYSFYDNYHTDSIFQMSRTIFPLNGIAKSQDSTKIAEEVKWQADNWILHKPFNSQNGTFERTFTNVGGIVTESISANEGMFTLEKRYAKLNGEWHLIYYQELLMRG